MRLQSSEDLNPSQRKEGVPMGEQSDQRSLSIRPTEQSQQSIEPNSSETSISQPRGSSLFGFGVSPQEFFSNNPSSLMRRMTEEVDRVIQKFRLEPDSGDRAGWSPQRHRRRGRNGYRLPWFFSLAVGRLGGQNTEPLGSCGSQGTSKSQSTFWSAIAKPTLRAFFAADP